MESLQLWLLSATDSAATNAMNDSFHISQKHFTAHVHTGLLKASANRKTMALLATACVACYPGQLSLVIPLCVGAMSTSQRVVTPCGWGVKAGMVCV